MVKAASRRSTRPTASSRTTIDRVTAYAERVLAGVVVAGPHVRNACRRHLDDLERGHERGLIFDADASAKACAYFEEVLKLRMRWNVHTRDLTPKDRLFCEGRTYDIAGVIEIRRREGVEALGAARIDQGTTPWYRSCDCRAGRSCT